MRSCASNVPLSVPDGVIFAVRLELLSKPQVAVNEVGRVVARKVVGDVIAKIAKMMPAAWVASCG